MYCEAGLTLSMSHVQMQYEEVYIDAPGNEQWKELYQYDIPVIHINGLYAMKHRVNEKLLAEKLANPP